MEQQRRTSGAGWTLDWIPDIERLHQHWDDPAVYFIVCKPTKIGYIGSARYLSQRIKYHFSRLGTNQHPNQKMQNAYSQYGHDNFDWGIVEICDVMRLEERERYWVKRYPPERLFNVDLEVSRAGKKFNITKEEAAKILTGYIGLDIDTVDNFGGWIEWFIVYDFKLESKFTHWFSFHEGGKYQALAGRVYVCGVPLRGY